MTDQEVWELIDQFGELANADVAANRRALLKHQSSLQAWMDSQPEEARDSEHWHLCNSVAHALDLKVAEF